MKATKLAILVACLYVCAAGGRAEPQHVILITIDGGAAYQLENAAVPLPNVRSLIRSGVWAESSESVFPSETGPSHTTIITGVLPLKHGVLGDTLFDRASGKVFPANSLPHSRVVLVKTIFDTAKAKHLVTAAILWPETIEDPSIDFNFTLRATGREHSVVENPWTRELRRDGVPVDLDNKVVSGGISYETVDNISTLAACDVIEKHKPNLLAVHLVSLDYEEHRFGPASPMAQAALGLSDALIGKIVAATKQADLFSQTAFIITADHGFASVYYGMNIRPFFADAGLAGKIRIYGEGWTPFIQLLPNFNPATDGPKLQRVFERLRKNSHILRIYGSADYPSLDLPRYEDSNRVQGQYLIVADIGTYLLNSPDNSTEFQKLKHPVYNHGYLPQYPQMYPLLVLSGDGFRKGVRIGHVHETDIAPTITRLLGLAPLHFDGRVLNEALQP